jgi:hypothetical protein
MSEPTKRDQDWTRWQERFARVRQELEQAAAKGDAKARRILAEVDGDKPQTVVNVPLPTSPAPTTPPRYEREPGEEG